MAAPNRAALDYDSVELRGGRLIKIRRSQARILGKQDVGQHDGGQQDRMEPVAKCYCRSHDVITAAEAEDQRRPTFVFPERFFADLEMLIGKELEGRIYSDSAGRRVRFHLDLREHAGFQLAEGDRSLYSPWYDDNVMKE